MRRAAVSGGLLVLAAVLAACAQRPPPPVVAAAAPATPLIDRLLALGLVSIPGPLPTHHPEGGADRAMRLRTMIEDAQRFYRAELGIDTPLQLAVLDRDRWTRAITWQPYGIPGVAGRPPVVFMPASDDNLAADDALSLRDRVSPAARERLLPSGLGYDEAARRYVDLVGLHELGHVYARAHGFRPPSRWLDELMATFYAFAFLKASRAADAALWEGVLQAYADGVRPAHRSLADFDRLYFGVGAQNYVWYQAQFQRMVARAHAAQGLDFVRRVSLAFPAGEAPAPPPDEVLRRLEAIQPGFVAWAAELASAGAPR